MYQWNLFCCKKTTYDVAMESIPFHAMIQIQSSKQTICNFIKLKLWKINYQKCKKILSK